ncbi:hypothetical protein AB0N31_26375 [Streptomyces sp. NPDC051051]
MKRRIAALWDAWGSGGGQCSRCGGWFPDWNGGICSACKVTGR